MKKKKETPEKRLPLRDLLSLNYPDDDRERLFAAVLCGDVYVDGQCLKDPAQKISVNSVLEIREKDCPYVSRGGLKLAAALDEWGVSVKGKTFVDAGASTGGFTDLLLRRGAAAVHSVDVGWNQLAWKLRRDERVFVHERTNIMALEKLEPQPNAGVADLSFRSLRGAAGKVLSLVSEGWLIALMKPQFEKASEGDSLDFDGVVESDEERRDLLGRLSEDLKEEGIKLVRWMDCPVKGRKGNREILLFLESTASDHRG